MIVRSLQIFPSIHLPASRVDPRGNWAEHDVRLVLHDWQTSPIGLDSLQDEPSEIHRSVTDEVTSDHVRLSKAQVEVLHQSSSCQRHLPPLSIILIKSLLRWHPNFTGY